MKGDVPETERKAHIGLTALVSRFDRFDQHSSPISLHESIYLDRFLIDLVGRKGLKTDCSTK